MAKPFIEPSVDDFFAEGKECGGNAGAISGGNPEVT